MQVWRCTAALESYKSNGKEGPEENCLLELRWPQLARFLTEDCRSRERHRAAALQAEQPGRERTGPCLCTAWLAEARAWARLCLLLSR